MGLSNLGYSITEALHHFKRNWSTALGAVVTIFLSLFIIGLFVVGSALVDSLVGSVENSVTIQAFLSDSAKPETVKSFQESLQGWGNIQQVRYKSKEQAFKEYQEKASSRYAADIVKALDGANPVPASFVITLDSPQKVASTAKRLVSDPTFKQICDDADNPSYSVQYGQGVVERLFTVTSYLRIGAVTLVALLVFVAFVFINNTIRLAISARRREIAIQRLVGASNGFIRGPFVMEVILEALIAGLLAVLLLHLLVSLGLPRLNQNLGFLSLHLSFDALIRAYIGMVGIGLVIGLFGSAIAMRRYLKV